MPTVETEKKVKLRIGRNREKFCYPLQALEEKRGKNIRPGGRKQT